jgi:hypothetical protein
MFFESPGGTASDAIVRQNQVTSPLVTAVTAAP